jgi:hypothetical protein
MFCLTVFGTVTRLGAQRIATSTDNQIEIRAESNVMAQRHELVDQTELHGAEQSAAGRRVHSVSMFVQREQGSELNITRQLARAIDRRAGHDGTRTLGEITREVRTQLAADLRDNFQQTWPAIRQTTPDNLLQRSRQTFQQSS